MGESLRSEHGSLQEKNKLLSRKLKRLLKQKKILSIVNEELLERILQLDSQLQEAKDYYLESSNHATSDTEKMVKKLEHLNLSVSQTIGIHSDSSPQGMELFPSKVSTNEYFQMEEEFTSSLTSYTKRQFFEGIADMAGSKDQLRYKILEVNKPESFLIRGESDDALQSKCKELKRLQSVYSNNQAIKLESLCNLRQVQASLFKTEDIISKIALQPAVFDIESLSSRIADLQRKCEEKTRHMKTIFDETLVPLIEEMSELQTAKILSGNFDLKIARQDYFISKQDAVIEELLRQNSRYEFLSMLYEIEAKSHRETYNLLSTADSLLKHDDKAVETRLALMESHLGAKPLRETIDTRDYFMQNLFKLFEKQGQESEKKPFITYAMLEENFKNTVTKAKKEIISSEYEESPEKGFLDDVKHQLAACTLLLLGNENAAENEETSEKISKIDDVLKTIEKSVKSAIAEIDSKKKILAADSLKALERTLFTNFFNDPTRLKRIVTELRTRVEALSR